MKYKVMVTQVDTFEKSFIVDANSEKEAEEMVQKEVDENPIDSEKNTYIDTEVTLVVKKVKIKQS